MMDNVNVTQARNQFFYLMDETSATDPNFAQKMQLARQDI
jgi:hypothetical protein